MPTALKMFQRRTGQVVTHVVSLPSARTAVKRTIQASVANDPSTGFFLAPVVSHRFPFFQPRLYTEYVNNRDSETRDALWQSRVARDTTNGLEPNSLQYVQTSARLGQRGRFLQMSWSTSADQAHSWRIGAVRLHALIRNMSAHGHGIQPLASEPRIQMWRAPDPHGQHIVPTTPGTQLTSRHRDRCSR